MFGSIDHVGKSRTAHLEFENALPRHATSSSISGVVSRLVTVYGRRCGASAVQPRR
jgi:hypothetical protein